MNLDPTELRKTLKGLSRRERRARARQAWNTLELWKDPEYSLLSRQLARKKSWQDYWPMWCEDYRAPTVIKANRATRRKQGRVQKLLKKITGLLGGTKDD